MLIAVTDTETTGLKIEEGAKAVEFAVTLFCTKTRSLVSSCSTILYHDQNPQEHTNRIPLETLTLHNWPKTLEVGLMHDMMMRADYIIAHKAAFDRPFVNLIFQEYNLSVPAEGKWICSLESMEFPHQTGSKKLTHLAADHGIFVVGSHRALQDTLTLAHLLLLIPNLEDQINNALIPRFIYNALVSFDQKEDAKAIGFAWHPEPKKWQRKLTEEEAEQINQSGLFQVEKA
jgi:DNA polymerase-3 subunit epsilon